MTRSRRLQPFELGIDLGGFVAAKGDPARDLVVDDIAALNKIDGALEFVPCLGSRLLEPLRLRRQSGASIAMTASSN